MTFFQSPGAGSPARNLLRVRATPQAAFFDSSASDRQNKALVMTALAAGVLAVCTIAALFIMPLAGHRADESSAVVGSAAAPAPAEAADNGKVADAGSASASEAPAVRDVQASSAVRPTKERVVQQPLIEASMSGPDLELADELSIANPRWSLAAGEDAPAAQAVAADDGSTADFVVVSDVNAAEIAAAADSGGDEPVIVVDETAAVAAASDPDAASGESASSDASSETGTDSELAVEPSDESTTAAIPQPAKAATSKGGSRNGRVTSAVNMRSGPDNGARVVGVIPAKASIKLIGGCKFWCNVEYKGRRGYIFKSFVR